MEIETKAYTDGTTATGVAPLPDRSPAQQDAEHAYKSVIEASIEELTARLDRLTDHVNREIGVAQDLSLHDRLEILEALVKMTREKIKEKTKLLD